MSKVPEVLYSPTYVLTGTGMAIILDVSAFLQCNNAILIDFKSNIIGDFHKRELAVSPSLQLFSVFSVSLPAL